MSILQKLKENVLVYDGAMGTLLQASGALKPGSAPEALNLTAPEVVRGIHNQYVDAGADIIETNTFGGCRLKLKQFGLDGKFKEINAAAVRIAKEAMGSNGFVAAGIGPLEQMVEPLGPILFDEAVAAYKEWVAVIAEEKPDIILFETFSDIVELKAAIIAAREVTETIPIQVQLTYEGGTQTVSGTPPEVAAISLSAMDVQIIGTNCSTGPEHMLNVVEKYHSYGTKYISVLPNAGMPELVEGKMVFPASPDDYAKLVPAFIDAGAHIIGGCCGTTPAHIAAVKKAIGNRNPKPRMAHSALHLTSRSSLFAYDRAKRPFVIGERINPTGKKMLSAELAEGKTSLIRRYAIEQTRNGADLLDVNVGASGADEVTMMKKAVRAVEAVSSVPLVIDSANPDILEVGLRAASGKVLINSVNGEEKHIPRVLSLAKKYGAAILILTTDEKGIPTSTAERIAIVKKVSQVAINTYGIPPTDIVVDPLALTLASEAAQAKETLLAIEEITTRFGFLTSLGLSNISFGLPDRMRVNTEFLSLASAYGLSFAIANPNDDMLMAAVRSQARSEKGDAVIEQFVTDALDMSKVIPPATEKKADVATESTKETIKGSLFEAILYGDKENIGEFVTKALEFGYAANEVNTGFLIPALEEVGRRFETKKFFLPQVIMAAESMQEAFLILKKAMSVAESKSKGKILFATVEGDFHDIGKNIVIAVLENYGYEIVDLGKDVSADRIVEAALVEKADVIGMSALMTTTMVRMEEVVAKIKEQGVVAKTMVGGAVLNQAYADKIGADAYAKNAIEAVSIVKRFIG